MPPHATQSARALALAETGAVEGLLCASSIGTLDYLLTRASGADASRQHLATLCRICAIAGTPGEAIDTAIGLDWPDLEDAIVHECARLAKADGIVTRDRTGFAQASVAVYSPTQLLDQVQPG